MFRKQDTQNKTTTENTPLFYVTYKMGATSGNSRISGLRYLSKSNTNSIEMHFECDFAPFRIQTLTLSHTLEIVCELISLIGSHSVPAQHVSPL